MSQFTGSFPSRVSVTTLNVWGSNYWPQRASSLVQTLLTLRSDIYMFQELTPDIVKYFDENLGAYERVKASSGEGWEKESNIYWNSALFEKVDSGFGDLGLSNKHRGLFWVRLALRSSPKQTIFVSTAHFPWAGCEEEIETGVNQRIVASVKVCEHLRRLVPPSEPAIFGGDLNDDFHPVRIFSEELAFIDVFEALDLPPPITHPVRPSDPREEMRPNKTLDWILCSLPSGCRVVAALTKTLRGGAYPPISDHFPVVAIFEIA